ncbi:hypothetical protein OG413_46310 [Streptomyces sp. NBC_01433]|uniref:hypothetical protein n=1 Tax=Streptomyces sp. NBC_01433 TaxID=2903864 RepID=UPI00224FB480|nr:hypothetical protein [Streptomyces sp. NBC_01433]MCX4682602.1 hypothetical protein [Streptomyces sp. NBC_01433]
MRKRSGRPSRFAAVPNETIDDSLSFDLEALGLLTVVLRHRDGYEITLPEIADKYGYGRDSLAGAWGMLQVARYIIKVKIQWAQDNKWSTEVVVYDTPATDDEIKDLLASIAGEPNVRTVKREPPTKSAQERAEKHAAKVKAKRKAKPELRKLDFDVPGENGRGRGTDQGAGAAAPAAPAEPPRKSAAPKKKAKKKEPGRRLTQQEAAAVKQVEAAFPEQLLLPSYRPTVLRDAILEALSARPLEVVVERVKRRWWKHGYEEAVMPGGKGIGSPIGVAVALVRPSMDCPDPMCEDGVVLDTGVPCRACELRKEDRRRPVPAPRGESGEGQGEGAPAPRRWKCRGCTTLGKTGTEAPEDGLCGLCRKDEQEAKAAAARLSEELAQAEALREAEREWLARERWVDLLEDAYWEHAERERAATEERERRDAEEQQRQRDAEERRLIQEQIARENPELLAYSQTASA